MLAVNDGQLAVIVAETIGLEQDLAVPIGLGADMIAELVGS